MATITEVARRAGVSTATVSRVLNDKKVAPEYVAAVRAAVAELGYQPDRTARSLRRRYSDVVALVLPDIENPFFTALARGVEDVAQDAGFSVVLCNSDDDPRKEARYLDIAVGDNMAGVILAPASATPDLGGLLDRGRAVVVVDRPVPDAVDQVSFDNVGLGREGTARLLAAGRTRVACVTGPREVVTAMERVHGWREAMAAAGLDAGDELLVHANYRVDGGRDALRRLLALPSPPDAVLATNNLVGVGVLQELHASWAGGADVGVAVIGDLPFATTPADSLVLLKLHPRAVGERAARMFFERLGGADTAPRHVVLPLDHLDDSGSLRQ